MGGVFFLLMLDVHTYVVQKRTVAHRINWVDVTPPYLLVAAVTPARLIMLADDVADQPYSSQCVPMIPHTLQINDSLFTTKVASLTHTFVT